MPLMNYVNVGKYRTTTRFAGTRWIISRHAGYWGFRPEEESELTEPIHSGVYTSRLKAYDALVQKAKGN